MRVLHLFNHVIIEKRVLRWLIKTVSDISLFPPEFVCNLTRTATATYTRTKITMSTSRPLGSQSYQMTNKRDWSEEIFTLENNWEIIIGIYARDGLDEVN
jgi:hypothetical protein